MHDRHTVLQVAKRLTGATSFLAVFGELPTGDVAAKKSYLRKQFSYLAGLVHPDHVQPDCTDVAQNAFRDLNALRHAAERAIVSGTYDAPLKAQPTVSADTDVFELVSQTGTYRLKNAAYREGDFSVVYRGVLVGAKPIPVIAKVAREPANNSWLEREAVILRRAQSARAGTPIHSMSRFTPALIDTIMVPGEKNTRYRANILRFESDMVSVADVIKAFPHGLDAPQAAWVARRIFAQTLAASMLKLVHAAITPDHVLVNPFTHDPIHIGWPHAIESGRITHVIDRWKDIYPPEVFGKKDVDHRTDIYMAGATIVRLMGGNVEKKKLPAAVPNEVAKVILRCLEANPARRPQDGLHLLNEFTKVVRAQWGRVYRPLTMPVH